MSLVIDTERLLIRPWQEADLENYLKLVNDVGYTAFVAPGIFPLDVEGARNFINERIKVFDLKRVGKFPIFLKQTGEILGTCGLSTYDFEGREELELGYRLLLEFWGKGYATEASHALLNYGYEELGAERILLFALPQNKASLQVMNRLGAKFLSTCFHANKLHNLYEITKSQYSEYLSLQEALSKKTGLRADNLEMNEKIQYIKSFWQLFSDQKWEEAKTLLHKDFEAVWPQSQEIIRGAQNFIDVNRYYPGNHKIEIVHCWTTEEKVLTTVWIEADTGQKTYANSIFEFKDKKIVKAEEYWAAPYPAPEWRKQWVEYMAQV